MQQTFLGLRFFCKRNGDPDIIWKENEGDICNTCNSKLGYCNAHNDHRRLLLKRDIAIIIGDSIAAGFKRYPHVWKNTS